MSLAVLKAEFFRQDYVLRFAWYLDEAGPDVARRFQVALDHSLKRLASHPDLGRLRRFKNPLLRGLRSFPVERPFNKILIFYREETQLLQAVRLVHGARDLPRRLLEPPDSTSG